MIGKIKHKKIISKQIYGFYFILPYFVIFIIFGLYPIIYTFYLSFFKWDGIMPQSFIGLANYERIFKDKYFLLSIWNTFRIWIINYIPQILTALLLSCIFTFNRIRGMKFFRAAYYLPNLITAASVGLLFNLLFNGDKSVVNYILLKVNIFNKPFGFFNSTVFTSNLVSYIQWWMWFGYTSVIIMAGMTTVDRNLYEAAMADGATKSKTFFYITLPLIRPTLLYLTVTSIIGGMQLFDVPATLTNGYGDPLKCALTSTMYIYNQGFKNHNFGYASTVSIGLFILIAILSVLSFKSMQKKGGNTYED